MKTKLLGNQNIGGTDRIGEYCRLTSLMVSILSIQLVAHGTNRKHEVSVLCFDYKYQRADYSGLCN